MLTLTSGHSSRDCAGQTRRDFLRAGLLGLGGLTLPWLYRKLFGATMVHELGHVLGLRHRTGALNDTLPGPVFNIMSQLGADDFDLIQAIAILSSPALRLR